AKQWPAILVPFGMGPSRLSPIRISTGDSAWNYEAVLKIYRRIEDWHGVPDPERCGTGGLLFIQPWPGTDPVIPATFEGVRSIGIPISVAHFGFGFRSSALILFRTGATAPVRTRMLQFGRSCAKCQLL